MAGAKGLRHKPQRLRGRRALLHRVIDVPGHEDRADLEAVPQFERSIDPVPSTYEADVHQHGIGLLLLSKTYRLVRTSRRADDLESCRGELAFEIQPDQDLIFNDENTPAASPRAFVVRRAMLGLDSLRICCT